MWDAHTNNQQQLSLEDMSKPWYLSLLPLHPVEIDFLRLIFQHAFSTSTLGSILRRTILKWALSRLFLLIIVFRSPLSPVHICCESAQR